MKTITIFGYPIITIYRYLESIKIKVLIPVIWLAPEFNLPWFKTKAL